MNKAIDYNKMLANSERASAQAYVTLSLSGSCSIANGAHATRAFVADTLYNETATANSIEKTQTNCHERI
jgi:hypothetical protein